MASKMAALDPVFSNPLIITSFGTTYVQLRDSMPSKESYTVLGDHDDISLYLIMSCAAYDPYVRARNAQLGFGHRARVE